MRSVDRMLPIAAPAIAAPTVAPASVALAEGILPGSSPAGPPTPEAAAQAGVDPSIFALLLAPSPSAELAVAPAVIPGDATIPSDTGLAALLSTFLGKAAEPSEDATKDGELLALLASFGATALPAQPVPNVAGSMIDDVLSEPLVASQASPVSTTTVKPLTPALPTEAPALPVLAVDEIANGDAAPVVSTKLPGSPPTEALAIVPSPSQRVAPAAELPTTSTPVPVTMPVIATEVEAEAAQSTAAVPAAPLLVAAGAVAEASRKPPMQSSARTPAQPQTAIDAVPIADVDPAAVAEALENPAPAMQVAAAELPKPKAMPAAADTIPAATPAPESPVLGMPAAAPPVASALPAAAPLPTPLPTPVLAPGTLALQDAESEAEAFPAAPHATASAAAVVAGDGSSLAVAAAPRAEPFAAVLRSEAAQPATGRAEPNPLERAVAHQVSRAIVQHLPDGGARMVMRLTPPELGTVRIEFISRDGMVTARLMAEDEGVRQALDRALPHIRAEVRGDHPTVDISVDRSDQRQAWGEGHARQERRDEPRTGQGRRRRDDEPLFTVDGVEPTVGPTPVRATQQLGGRVGPTLVDALA